MDGFELSDFNLNSRFGMSCQHFGRHCQLHQCHWRNTLMVRARRPSLKLLNGCAGFRSRPLNLFIYTYIYIYIKYIYICTDVSMFQIIISEWSHLSWIFWHLMFAKVWWIGTMGADTPLAITLIMRRAWCRALLSLPSHGEPEGHSMKVFQLSVHRFHVSSSRAAL